MRNWSLNWAANQLRIQGGGWSSKLSDWWRQRDPLILITNQHLSSTYFRSGPWTCVLYYLIPLNYFHIIDERNQGSTSFKNLHRVIEQNKGRRQVLNTGKLTWCLMHFLKWHHTVCPLYTTLGLHQRDTLITLKNISMCCLQRSDNILQNKRFFSGETGERNTNCDVN